MKEKEAMKQWIVSVGIAVGSTNCPVSLRAALLKSSNYNEQIKKGHLHHSGAAIFTER